MRTFGLLRLAVPFLALILSVAAGAQALDGSAPGRELLNSERIEATFGSYGVEVLEASPRLRVSSLQSRDADGPICRTFAVVRYPDALAQALTAEHAAIAAGGSIGAVFTSGGWSVTKTHLHYGAMPAGARAAKLMAIPAGTVIALHVYLLEVAKDGFKFPYATIAELHHPEYLGVEMLRRIYGPPDAGGNEPLLAAMLESAARAANGPAGSAQVP